MRGGAQAFAPLIFSSCQDVSLSHGHASSGGALQVLVVVVVGQAGQQHNSTTHQNTTHRTLLCSCMTRRLLSDIRSSVQALEACVSREIGFNEGLRYAAAQRRSTAALMLAAASGAAATALLLSRRQRAG